MPDPTLPGPPDDAPDTVNLFSFLQVLAKWRRFLLINVLVIAVGVAVYIFLTPNTFRASASIIPPKEDSGLSGTITQLTKDFLPSGVLGKFGANKGAYNYLAILESRRAMEAVAKKFELAKVYDVSSGSMEKTIAALRDNAAFDIEENDNISVAVVDIDPRRAADMANYFVDLLNEISIDLGTREATNNRLFIEKRYKSALDDMRNAEDSLRAFQKKYGIYALPEQTKAAIEEAAAIKAQASLAEVELGILERSLGADNTTTALKRTELSELNNKLRRIKYGSGVAAGAESSEMFPPFKDIPDLGIKYLRLYREFEIQTKILQFAIPMYEQAKIDEQKTVPVVLVLDRAVPPEKKYAPKRTIVVLVAAMLAFFLFSFCVFLMESFLHRRGAGTSIESGIRRRIERLMRFYRVS